MEKVIFLGAVLLLPILFTTASGKSYKVVCYLGSWANYRPGEGKFVIEDIDTSLCTHLIYGFAKLDSDNKIAAYDSYLDLKENWGLGAYERFNNLKQNNSNLKTLIAIGGWNEGSTKYSQMAADQSTRKIFVESAVQFLVKYKFDGLDLDWEYPANRGGNPEDKQNFVALAKELKDAFQQYGFLLSAAVSAGQKTIDSAYDIPELAKYLDFINLMAYDFHGSWDQNTGHNAPLYAGSNDETNSVDYAVKYWISKGAPAEKIILGMGLYGRGFKLQDPGNNGLGAPVSGPSSAGEITKQPGMLGYNEICKMLQKEKGWTVVFESTIQAPYAYKEDQWIGYDNVKSMTLKVKYAQKMNLGGGMVWSLETDDFLGKCHGQRYPLLRAIKEGLDGKTIIFPPDDRRYFVTPEAIPNSSRIVAYSTERTSTVNAATESNNDMLPCSSSGYFRHPKNCKMFYYCQPMGASSKYQPLMFNCAEGTVYSQQSHVCVFPYQAPECS